MVRYALAIAAEADDYRDRELGLIHLLKYIYLGDMAFAEEHEGESYSGTQWVFYRFGPWSAEVHSAIPATIDKIGGTQRQIPSQYRDDWVRFSLSSCQDLVAAELPPSVSHALGRAVRTFHNDTYPLLHYVYRTPPMLNAAPGDVLLLRSRKTVGDRPAAPPPAALPSVSKTQIKKLRARVQEYLAARKQIDRAVADAPGVSYDSDYFEILDLLDMEPGAPIEPSSGVLEFGADVWRSSARRDSEIP